MNEKKPASKNASNNSKLHAGRDVHLGDVTYIIQGENVTIPRHLTNHIPVNAEHLIGREPELATIATHLAENRPTVLVNGIGGIGKTSVATKFMALHGTHYKHLAWLTVTGSLAETFVNHTILKDSLHIEPEVRELVEARNIADAFALVFKKLNDLEKTLLVIDNANELADLLEHKPLFDNCNCHVLITSRNRPQDWSAVVPVEALPAAEAVQLFKKLAPLQDPEATDTAIKNLLSKLYFHALLIELVAKAVASAGLTFGELQEMIDTRFIHHDTLREEIISTGKHGDSQPDLAKRANIEDYIWLIFNQVQGLSDTSKDILRGMALLPLATPIEREDLKEHLAIWNIENFTHPLTMLVERGWIDKVQATGKKPQYKMHPLIADVVIKHLEVNAEFAEVYTEHIADMIYYDSTNKKHNLFEINKSRALAERLSNLFWNENREEVSELLHSLNWLNQNFGLYEKAAKLGERALQIAQNQIIENVALVAKNQSTLSLAYKDLGRYTEAAELLESALKNDLNNFGQDHPEVAASQSNLALVYGYLDRYTEAADLLETALKSDLNNFGKDHPIVAIRQSNLAGVYGDLGRHTEAADLLETALESDLNNFGEDHQKVAIRQCNLALVYGHLDRFAEAADLLEMALKSDLKNFDKDHPTVAIDQYNLAVVYIKTDRKLEAKALLQAAYQNFLNNFGEAHPYTIAVQKWFPKAE